MGNCLKYIKGLFQSGKRNIERINETVPGSDYESTQHFISNSPWRAKDVFEKLSAEASELYSNCSRVGLIIDESAHKKKGNSSVGVGRQYCGQLGKVDNCQVAVYAALSVQPYCAIIDTELYLPLSWTADEERCKRAGVPQERMAHKTKCELALEIIKRQRSLGTRFHWVGADGFYGQDFKLGKELDDMGQLFVFEVHEDQRAYLQKPEISVPQKLAGARGRNPSKLKTDIKPMKASDFGNTLDQAQWHDIVVRYGKKGQMRANVSVQKVYVWDKKETHARERLLIIRKTRNNDGKEVIKYALTNAKEGEYSINDLALMLSERYFIERAFQEAKEQIGMSEYQVRGWLAWHHHIALVCLSMMFILREKVIFSIKKPLLSAYDVRQVIIGTYSKKANNYDDIVAQIDRRHKQRLKDEINKRQGQKLKNQINSEINNLPK